MAIRNFVPPPVAGGNNRVNTQGVPLPDKRNRTSNTFNQTVAPGQVLPIPCTGTQFYVLFTSAPISIRPSRGTFNAYNTGQGLRLDDETAFNQIELQNTTANTIVVSVFVGYQDFIDQTLIINNVTNPNVVFPTYPTPSIAATININDLSGTQFTDINAKKWYAISRVAILIFNTDSGSTYLVQKSGSAVSNGPAIGAVFPLTAIRLDVSGNYTMATGGGNINVVVSEIYNAIPATS